MDNFLIIKFLRKVLRVYIPRKKSFLMTIPQFPNPSSEIKPTGERKEMHRRWSIEHFLMKKFSHYSFQPHCTTIRIKSDHEIKNGVAEILIYKKLRILNIPIKIIYSLSAHYQLQLYRTLQSRRKQVELLGCILIARNVLSIFKFIRHLYTKQNILIIKSACAVS